MSRYAYDAEAHGLTVAWPTSRGAASTVVGALAGAHHAGDGYALAAALTRCSAAVWDGYTHPTATGWGPGDPFAALAGTVARDPALRALVRAELATELAAAKDAAAGRLTGRAAQASVRPRCAATLPPDALGQAAAALAGVHLAPAGTAGTQLVGGWVPVPPEALVVVAVRALGRSLAGIDRRGDRPAGGLGARFAACGALTGPTRWVGAIVALLDAPGEEAARLAELVEHALAVGTGRPAGPGPGTPVAPDGLLAPGTPSYALAAELVAVLARAWQLAPGAAGWSAWLDAQLAGVAAP